VTPKLETSRMILEPITVGHAEELVELFADPRLHTFVPFEPPTLEQQQKRCARWEQGKSPDGLEIWLNWTGRDKASGQVMAHFQSGVKLDHTASIGYVVSRKFQGQGFALEGMMVVLDVLRDRFHVAEVKAWTDTRNEASHRLARKLGMEVIETIKDADNFKGTTSDEYVFALTLRV
jgi:ribosomal-protein-alanine N-acetyltransferase